jgi:hypothetical protein
MKPALQKTFVLSCEKKTEQRRPVNQPVIPALGFPLVRNLVMIVLFCDP